MRDRPIFDSEHPDDVDLTDDERAAIEEGMRRRRVLQDAEGGIPDMGGPMPRKRPPTP